ncbi:hypothetical protein [Saccharothrix stipae]
MAEQKRYRGEGGRVWTMDLPLPAEIAKQVEAGALVEVEASDPPSKPLTPKEALQEQAAELGLDTSGTVAELTARIDAKLAE